MSPLVAFVCRRHTVCARAARGDPSVLQAASQTERITKYEGTTTPNHHAPAAAALLNATGTPAPSPSICSHTCAAAASSRCAQSAPATLRKLALSRFSLIEPGARPRLRVRTVLIIVNKQPTVGDSFRAPPARPTRSGDFASSCRVNGMSDFWSEKRQRSAGARLPLLGGAKSSSSVGRGPVPPPTGAAFAQEGEQAIEEGAEGGARRPRCGLLAPADGRQLDAHRPDGAAPAAGIPSLVCWALLRRRAPGTRALQGRGAAGRRALVFNTRTYGSARRAKHK